MTEVPPSETPSEEQGVPPGREPTPPTSPSRAWDSAELLQGQREVLIRHGDQTYRLQITQNGKLILVK